MNFGLSSEGFIEMNLISFKRNTSYYLIQFFFQIILYVFIHMIFFNVVLATITNGYDKMKEIIDKRNYDEKNVCFICDKTRNDCIEDNEDFDEHLERHNKWKYIIYIINIILKNKEEYTNEEFNIRKQIKKKKLDWFPKYEKKSDESEENKNNEKKEEEEDKNSNKQNNNPKIIEINFVNKKEKEKIENNNELFEKRDNSDIFEVEKISDEDEEKKDNEEKLLDD